MTIKEKVLNAVTEIPPNVDFEEILAIASKTTLYDRDGNVSHLLESSMGLKRKLISVDKQTDDNIMHHNGFRKANRLSS